jgi:2-methylisocitrate lyase-like PEP mutase family enzyme
MTKRLRDIFHRPGLTIVPGGTSPLHAMMAERSGYEAFYMSGSMTTRWLLGWPDVGVTTMREMADNANRIAKCVSIPIFADIDTGYGTAINVYRSVKEYIWAGVAGCHLEDQEFPKKSGSMAGRRLISLEEALGKYRAAIDAKREMDPNFVICARSDARGAEGGGFEEVVRRAKAYEEAGVDVIFFESLQSWEECQIALKSVNIPAFCLLHDVMYKDSNGNSIPGPSLQEQEAAGQKIALYVGLMESPANQAAWEALVDFREKGVDSLNEWRVAQEGKTHERLLPTDLLSISRVRAMEEKYYPKNLQRDYDTTIGRRAGDPGT